MSERRVVHVPWGEESAWGQGAGLGAAVDRGPASTPLVGAGSARAVGRGPSSAPLVGAGSPRVVGLGAIFLTGPGTSCRPCAGRAMAVHIQTTRVRNIRKQNTFFSAIFVGLLSIQSPQLTECREYSSGSRQSVPFEGIDILARRDSNRQQSDHSIPYPVITTNYLHMKKSQLQK